MDIESYITYAIQFCVKEPTRENYLKTIQLLEKEYPNFPTNVRLCKSLRACLINYATSGSDMSYNALKESYTFLARAMELDNISTPTDIEKDHCRQNLAIVAKSLAILCDRENTLDKMLEAISYARFAMLNRMSAPSTNDFLTGWLALPAVRCMVAFRLARFYAFDKKNYALGLDYINEAIACIPVDVIKDKTMFPDRSTDGNIAFTKADLLNTKAMIEQQGYSMPMI